MREPDDKQRSLASSSALFLGGKLVANIGYFVGVSIVARALGPSGRGTVAFVTVSTLLVATVASLGVGAAAVVFIPKRPELRGRLYTSGVLFVAVSSLVIGTLVIGTMIALGAEPTGVSAALFAVCIPAAAALALMDLGLSYMVAVGRTFDFTITIAVAPWIYPGMLALVAAFATVNVGATVAVWFVASAASGVLALLISRRALGAGPFDRALLAEVVPFGFRAWLGGLAGSLNFRIDQMLMGFLATEAALGIYAVAVNVSEVVLYIPSVVGVLLVPLVARTESGARDDAVARVFRLSLLVTLGTSLVGAIVGVVLIPAWFGSAYDGSVRPFLLLLPGSLGFVAMRLFSNALLGSSRPGRSSLAPVVALALGVVLDLALIPPYGASGAAIAASGALVAGGVAAIFIYYRPSRIDLREIVPRPSDLTDLAAILGRLTSRNRR